MRLRLGTRGSTLARTQSGHVADALAALGHDVRIVTIRSEGDVTSGSLLRVGGLGVFAAALRVALLDGEVDLVVHSLKDLPTSPVDGLVVAATPERERPLDVLCARDGLTFAELPEGARVGTGSPRRAAQLRARRPDLNVVEIRGNVTTRLARAQGDGVTPGDLDAVVLAGAGLARLGLLDAVTDTLDLLPAPGQGALAVECRADDAALRAALAPLDHPETRLCVTVERAILATLGAGCAAPVGAHADITGGHLDVTASVFSASGADAVTVQRSVVLPFDAVTDPVDGVALGEDVAAALLAEGAAAITPLGAERESRLAEFHHEQALWAPGTQAALVGRRILLPRTEGALASAIRAAGADVDAIPITRQRRLPFTLPPNADWLLLTSPAGVRVLAESGIDIGQVAPHIAAVGQATAVALASAGVDVDVVPEGRFDADALLAALPAGPASAILATSALASPRLAEGLRERGWSVEVVSTYTTEPITPTPAVRPWGDYDAVVLTAGSVARALVGAWGVPPDGVAVIAFGQPSAAASAAVGLRVDAIAASQDGPGVVDALIRALTEETR